MMPPQPRLLASWLIAAVVLGLIAWRLWRRGKMRFSALEAVVFKRTPEGWTFDSPYPRIFSRRRWTYLLTNAQKERLTEGLRRCMRTAALMTIGFVVLLAIPLAFWLPKLPDLLRWLLAGSPSVWLLLCFAPVLVWGALATAVFLAQKRWFHPVLSDARRIGPAGPLSALGLMAEMTAVGDLRIRIIGITLVLLACGLFACVTAYLSPSSLDAELLLVMAVLFGLLDVWYVGVLVLKRRGGKSLPGGPWGSSGSG
jgi:hypothetical protein